tara:strand:+ start:1021 stop:1278 length:258 start_codon:yes stop_codon:yes gene_type:complete
MRKTFNNALKVIKFRLEEERQRIKEAKADMKKFEYGSKEYEHASIIHGASLQWEGCLESLLQHELTDFNMKYFDELNEHKNKFTD